MRDPMHFKLLSKWHSLVPISKIPMKQIIHINIGQSAINIADSTLRLYVQEHALTGSQSLPQLNHHLLFQQSAKGAKTFRAVSVDCDRYSINEKLNGSTKCFYHPDWSIGSSDSSGGIFAEGKRIAERNLTEQSMQVFRKLQEGSDKVEAIIVNACSLGGTAGFMDSIMTKLAQSAPKIPKIGYILYPSAHLSSSLVEIYNYTLSVNATLNHFDLVVPFDNEMLYTTAEKHLDVQYPGFGEINHILAQMQSSITISQRAPGILNTDFRDLLTNIVCYPRIHYAYPSFVGLDSDLRAASIRTTDDMTRAILDPSSQLMDMRRLENKLGVALFYRGYVEPFEVLKALQRVREEKPPQCRFQEWTPTGFKVAINNRLLRPRGNIRSSSSCCSLINSLEFGFPLSEANLKFDRLYSQRSFVHHYVGSGMEEGEFLEAREDLAALEKDYEPFRLFDQQCYGQQ